MGFEIKHDYIHSLGFKGFGMHAYGDKTVYDARQQFIRELLDADLDLAKQNIIASEMVYGSLPEDERVPGAHDATLKYKERTEEAIKGFESVGAVDYVLYWGAGYLLRLVSDYEESKIQVYVNSRADITNRHALDEFEPFRHFIENKKQLRLVNFKEDNNNEYSKKYFWHDLDGIHDKEPFEKLENMYGKDYKMTVKDVKKAVDLPVLSVIPYDKDVIRSFKLSLPITLLNPKSKSSKEFKKLAKLVDTGKSEPKSSVLKRLVNFFKF